MNNTQSWSFLISTCSCFFAFIVAADAKIWSKVAKLDIEELLKQRTDIVATIREHYLSTQDTQFFRLQASTPNPQAGDNSTPSKKTSSSSASSSCTTHFHPWFNNSVVFTWFEIHCFIRTWLLTIINNVKLNEVFVFWFAIAPASSSPKMDNADDDDSGLSTLVSVAASVSSSSSDPQLVAAIRELNTTLSSRLSAVAVGVEKGAVALTKLLSWLEAKEREETKNKLKAAVETASSASEVKSTLVCFIFLCLWISYLFVLIYDAHNTSLLLHV